MLPFDLPAGLTKQAALGPRWAHWLDGLPRTVSGLVQEWGLTYDGAPRHGFCSLVSPVRTTGGRPAVLKVALPNDENEHEHLALQRWRGDGAVLMLRAQPRRYALLLERLHPEDLTSLWDLQACEIVAGFYPRLHVPALPRLARSRPTSNGGPPGWPHCRGTRRCRDASSSRRCPWPGPSWPTRRAPAP